MTEQSKAENAISLSSVDGKKWTDINGKHVDAANVQGTVTRLVIGELGRDEEIEHSASLLQEALTHHGKTITHLHLWNLKDLKHLEVLPPNLQCLDLRGCEALTRISELPETLKTLDLEGCGNLSKLPTGQTPNLRFLHLDGCTSLKPSAINSRIGICPQLEELTLSDCTKLRELDDLGSLADGDNAPLRKLVLKGCKNLKALPDLNDFGRLNHLNLNGCSALEELPVLPILEDPDPPRKYKEPVLGLRYLVAAGCESLRTYRGLDLRPVHLSDHDDDNIIDTLRALHFLGQPPAQLLSSKLLLLGSGRVGKTTLAKALQWADLDEVERTTEKGEELNPCRGSSSTEDIKFWRWETEFELRPDVIARMGQVHIWDFAGQEIYHNTHRLFAASGSVFVIVCCDQKTHQIRLEEEIKREALSGAALEVFQKQNLYRPVRYWLDFVRSAIGAKLEDLEKLPVLMVHSEPGSNDWNYLLDQAGPYREAIEKKRIPVECLDCGSEAYAADTSFKQLKCAISTQLAAQAEQLGIQVPAFYRDSHKAVVDLFPKDDSIPSVPAFEFDCWAGYLTSKLKILEGEREGRYPPLAFKSTAMRAVTRHLHRIGQVFWLDELAEGDVIVDQQLGTATIYALCRLGPESNFIRSKGGTLLEQDLTRCLQRVKTAHDLSLSTSQLLQLLSKCDICLPVSNDYWQALNSDLLPPFKESIFREVSARWYQLVSRSDDYVNHCFRISGSEGMMIGSADMQAVMAWVVRGIRNGEQGRGLPEWLAQCADGRDPRVEIEQRPVLWRAEWQFWKNGVQVCWTPEFTQEQFHWHHHGSSAPKPDESPGDPFLLRIQFVPFEGNSEHDISYAGSLYVELLTRDEVGMGERLRQALFADDGPLAFFRECNIIDDTRPHDHPAEWSCHPRDSTMWPWAKARNPSVPRERHDVAISVRGVNTGIAEALLRELMAEGINTYYYRQDEELKLEQDQGESGLLRKYQYLDEAQCLVLICSREYFDISETTIKKGNLHCPVELAAAVSSLKRKQPKESKREAIEPRNTTQIFILALEDNDFTLECFDTSVKDTLTEFKSRLIDGHDAPSELQRERRRWIETSIDDFKTFLDGCGQASSQVVTWDRSQEALLPEKIQEMVQKIKTSLSAAQPKDRIGP